MVEITLNIKKSIEQNAADYFERAKKARKKIEGVKPALERLKKQLENAQNVEIVLSEEAKVKKLKEKRKQEWFEKFHWFISSEGFLCVGGRDATTNEIIVKKHTDKEDFVFHTEAPGSPFFIVKVKSGGGAQPTKKTFEETAIATASFSKGWKLGVGNMEVFMIKPDQVSKEAQAGQYVAKGAFMIYGKREYFKPKMEFAIGMTKEGLENIQGGLIMSGPLEAVKKSCEKYLMIEPGNEKTSAIAKLLQKKVGGELDEIIRALPAGGCKVRKEK